MRIVQVLTPPGTRFGVVVDDYVCLLDVDGRSDGFRHLFGAELSQLSQLARASSERVPFQNAALAAPLSNPSKIVCVGLNYIDHADESDQKLPEVPLLFAKFPSSIIGPNESLQWPSGLTEQVDFEAELGVVIGTTLRDGSPRDAREAIFGYVVANDVSGRDIQFSDGQWVRSKSIDTFCPVGPSIVTADEFGDPQAAQIRTYVNGVCLQDAPTSDMIFPVAELLSWISGQITLVPGDLVLTGTPPGVGAFRTPPIFLKPGDVVDVEIDGIGTLRNPVEGDGVTSKGDLAV